MMPLTIDKQEAILFAIRFMLSSDPMGQYQKRADAVRVLEGMLQEAAESPRIDAEVRQTFRPSEEQRLSHGGLVNPRDLPDEDGWGFCQEAKISAARSHLITYLRAHMTLAQMKEQLAQDHGIHWGEETILRCLAGLTA